MQSLCNAITKHGNEYNFFSYKGLHIMITYYGIYIKSLNSFYFHKLHNNFLFVHKTKPFS